MTPEKRYEMWQGKLSWAVSEGGLSNSERDRVIEFKNTIKASWFDESYLSNEENAVYIHDYYMSWIAESIIDIGMSENLVYSILVRLDKSDDQFHSLNIGNSHYDAENNNSYHKEDGSGTCECSNTSDWCDSSGGGAIAHCKLNAENCTHSTLGCGTLWTYTCDGMCVLGPEDPGTE